MIVNLLLILLQ